MQNYTNKSITCFCTKCMLIMYMAVWETKETENISPAINDDERKLKTNETVGPVICGGLAK